jgi:hypothetical protein
MKNYIDNLIHYTVLAFGIAFFVKGFIPLSKIAVSAAPLPTTVKAGYNA